MLSYKYRIPGRDCRQYWDLNYILACSKFMDNDNFFNLEIKKTVIKMMDKTAAKYFKLKKKAWLAKQSELVTL